jgi:hypothetical protein
LPDDTEKDDDKQDGWAPGEHRKDLLDTRKKVYLRSKVREN